MLKVNAASETPIILNGEAIEEMESFTYFDSIVDKQGGTDADVKVRIGKARAAFLQLNRVWTSRELSTNTKIRLFNTNVKPVLMYRAETWRTTVTTSKNIQTFINRCLRRILQIHWPDTISNEELWQRTRQKHADVEIRQRRWGWIGHTLRKTATNTTRQALRWNPQGEAGHETPGVATLRPTPRRWAAFGNSWRDSPRTETVGET